MPLYRLVDADTEDVLKIRRMSHETARHLNEGMEDGREWRRGLSDEKVRPVRSLHDVLRGLDTEGFNSHSINVIERYLDQEASELSEGRRRYHSVKERFRNGMKTVSPEQKQTIHAFISLQCSHSFRAGLRLGITEHTVAAEMGKAEDTAEG